MANDGEWRTVQYFVQGVTVIKCFHPRMLAPIMAKISTNYVNGIYGILVPFAFMVSTKQPLFKKN